MRYFLPTLLLIIFHAAACQSANQLHYKAVFVDTHNDVLSSSMLE
jgi:hypothetical protein